VPLAWIKVFAGLHNMEMPGAFTADRWRHIVDDAEIFLRQWGSTAFQLGWSILDVFGVHPVVPASRFDAMGLVPLLHGNEVIALTGSTATIRAPSKAILTFRRNPNPIAVLISEVRP
jgi:hypothetical protein